MNEEEATMAVLQLVAELDEARYTYDDAQRRMVGLRKLIDGYVELYPLLEQIVGDHGVYGEEAPAHPRGMDAVARVLVGQQGMWLGVSEVVAHLHGLGWMPVSSNPMNATRAALERLVERNSEEFERGKTASGAVVYRQKPPSYEDEYGEEPF